MKKEIIEDLSKIKSHLGDNFNSFHLFGSSVKSLKNSRDIDIMIRVKNKNNSTEIIKNISGLNIPIGNISYNCYDGYKGKITKYDFIVVSDKDIGDYFFSRNKSNFKMIVL